jgi:hypothetical protein
MLDDLQLGRRAAEVRPAAAGAADVDGAATRCAAATGASPPAVTGTAMPASSSSRISAQMRTRSRRAACTSRGRRPGAWPGSTRSARATAWRPGSSPIEVAHAHVGAEAAAAVQRRVAGVGPGRPACRAGAAARAVVGQVGFSPRSAAAAAAPARRPASRPRSPPAGDGARGADRLAALRDARDQGHAGPKATPDRPPCQHAVGDGAGDAARRGQAAEQVAAGGACAQLGDQLGEVGGGRVGMHQRGGRRGPASGRMPEKTSNCPAAGRTASAPAPARRSTRRRWRHAHAHAAGPGHAGPALPAARPAGPRPAARRVGEVDQPQRPVGLGPRGAAGFELGRGQRQRHAPVGVRGMGGDEGAHRGGRRMPGSAARGRCGCARARVPVLRGAARRSGLGGHGYLAGRGLARWRRAALATALAASVIGCTACWKAAPAICVAASTGESFSALAASSVNWRVRAPHHCSGSTAGGGAGRGRGSGLGLGRWRRAGCGAGAAARRGR